MRPGKRLQVAFAALGSLLAAIVFAWPLPLYMGTRVTGRVSGDTGVYIWNLWQFRHQIAVHHRLPYFTGEILSLTPPIDLSLHNYTVFADLLAFPLIPLAGVVASFNLAYLVSTALTAFATFLLVRRVVGRSAEAWLAGILFAFSPTMVARGTAHFSLVQAAALPAFVLCWDRMLETRRPRFAVGAGLALAWAVMSDVYYGIFCLVLAALMTGWRAFRIERSQSAPRRGPMWAVDVPIAIAIVLYAVIAATGGTTMGLGPVRIGLSTLYTPALVLTCLVLLRLFLTFRPGLVSRGPVPWKSLLAGGGIAAACTTVALAPMLWALATRLAGGGQLQRGVYWRTGPGGIDLLSFFAPNPVHPLLGGTARLVLERPHDAIEGVAAVTFVALAVILFAAVRLRWRPPATWVVITLSFAALAIGPFLHIGGVNTYLPGPWAVLRYVPLLGTARTPARFAIVVILGVAVMFGAALAAWRDRSRHPRVVLGVVAAALMLELAPAPRALFSAEYPDVYRVIAADPRPVRVLNLPFGIRDGTMEVGGFNTAYQFYQTLHEKPLIGGYLSRIPRARIARCMRVSFLDAVTRLSEDQEVSEAALADAAASAPRFARRFRLGYVVVDRRRASEALTHLVLTSLPLDKIAVSGPFELYRARLQPAPSFASTEDLLR